ncbi:hypothetical protein VTN00DRAFT_1801 [Thermoascus crustaceus]|uniref:uncharacterized protein n=1 Tax=Thermoascus crustaceus TaxID=5088 RepID=UPI0037428C99
MMSRPGTLSSCWLRLFSVSVTLTLALALLGNQDPTLLKPPKPPLPTFSYIDDDKTVIVLKGICQFAEAGTSVDTLYNETVGAGSEELDSSRRIWDSASMRLRVTRSGLPRGGRGGSLGD